MKITYSSSSGRERHYVPVALGNGMISLQLDKEGCMKQNTYCAMTPQIVCSGKRYEDRSGRLIRFGYFDDVLPGAGELLHFSQTLDRGRGLCECLASYASGLEVKTAVFCHLGKNIIVISKEFSRPIDYLFKYSFPGGPFLSLREQGEKRIGYSSGSVEGFVEISSPSLSSREWKRQEDGSYTLTLEGKECQRAVIFLGLDEKILKDHTFEGLLEEHSALWKEFWRQSFISIPDEDIREMYRTAQYHLKISSTFWSLPTGLFPTHWEGRFFAYDEFYTHGALLSSGHFKEALKIDHFRSSILPLAIRRACYTAKCPEENRAARFPWETREDGTEGAPDGFWMDRYSHMANAAFSAWEAFCFTGDKELLEKELYPLIRACAEYIRRCGIYYDSANKPYIGKCTDMEKFGEFIEKPYSTTCGSIAVFRAASYCGKLLGQDPGLLEKWELLAEGLLKNLPQEKDQYLPYPACKERSIAMYHGLFPYGVIPPEDPMQKKAIADTEKHLQDFAGQYSSGSNLTAWYAGVIATAEIRRGDPEKALELIREAARNTTGCFYECFEVYERGKLPWFSTAAGALIRAVNELLIYGKEHNIALWKGEEYSFSLPLMKFVAGKVKE